MSGFDDGPLTGAPISFPKSSQEGACCPPVLAQGQYQVPPGLAETALVIDGEKLADVTEIEIKRVNGSSGTTPTLVSSTITESPGFLDQLRISMNTVGANSPDTFAVTVTNECGCCGTAIFRTIALP